MSTLQQIWRTIYPSNDEHKWMALIWLPFMVWFFVDPAWKHAGPLLWIANTAAGLLFIWLYLYSFSHPEPQKFYAVIAMTVMAAVAIPLNDGGIGLLVYAVASGAFTVKRRYAFSFIVIEVAILCFY